MNETDYGGKILSELNIEKELGVVVRAADDKHGEDIVALDMQSVSLLADYFVIVSANSQRQIEAIVDGIDEQITKAGYSIRRIEGNKNSNWVLIDLGDIVVHVFQTEERQFYNLEKLWSEAPQKDVSQWLVK